MSLDALVDEITARSQAELERLRAAQAAERQRLVSERDQRIAAIRTEQAQLAKAEAARARAQLVAAAKVRARQRVYEARAKRFTQNLADARALLEAYTESDEYPATLKRMVAAAIDALGKQVRIVGRAQDASRLAKAAGKAFDATPRPILGGLIAETVDKRRQLDLSFDELLRRKESRVRELLG
jgi:vacuolar-type H+-ATPase subunit E/Vma4